MLNVKQFRYGADNFAYVIYGKTQSLAVDAGAPEEIRAFLKRSNLQLAVVANTHDHFDHTSGNDRILRAEKARFLGFADLSDNGQIKIDGENIFVYRTPGHSTDSVCFHTGKFLISGDTLFNGTIGNCFTGDLKSFYLSIRRLMALPDETVVYAGHDYVGASLAFAAYLEPGNEDIGNFRKAYDPGHVFSTMADERRINPYLRFNEKTIIGVLKKRGLPAATEWERWHSLMSIE